MSRNRSINRRGRRAERGDGLMVYEVSRRVLGNKRGKEHRVSINHGLALVRGDANVIKRGILIGAHRMGISMKTFAEGCALHLRTSGAWTGELHRKLSMAAS